MKGEWIILLWVLLGVVFLVKTAPVGDLVRRVRRQSPVIQAAVAFCLFVAVITGGPKLVETNELSSSFQAEIVAPENSSIIIQKSSLLPTGWNHDSADTDGDGIPDLWEKWTHGNRQVADGNIDRDEDGLTDLEEFQNQTDPRTADTDGDGFDDAYEVGCGMNPLVQEDFTPVEPDENENGIIDLWENAPYFVSFTDADHDGFDDIYEAHYLEPASADNFDVVVEVYTTRSAALTWTTTNATQGFVLRASASTSVRLRLPFGEDTQIALICSPTGGVESVESLFASQSMQVSASTNAIPELWKARIRVDYASRHTPDGPFLDDGNGRFVEIVNPSAALIAALLPDPASSTAACGVRVESHACKVDGLVSSACRVHSGPVAFVCEKTKGDHTVGYEWSSEPSGVIGDTMTNLVSVANFQTGTYEVKCTVTCKRGWWSQSRTTHSVALLNVYDCTTPPVILSVYDNEWHIPTNMAATCGTPERVYVGFDHAKVNTRNLPRITVGDLEEDLTEHGLGIVWEDNGQIDLFSLLGGNSLPYKDDLTFTTTGCTVNGGVLSYGDDPGIYSPDVCLVTVVHTPTTITLDHLWVVVNASNAETEFDAWLSANTNLAWTLGLPRPFSSIEIAAGVPQDPEPGEPNEWSPPVAVSSYLHHDAVYEARTEPGISGVHGHQATYSSNGEIITQTIAAGTADFRKPRIVIGGITVVNGTAHKEADVEPFVLALQLDGNPVEPRNIWRTLNRPCLYQGPCTESYITCRPIVPSGTQNRGN